MRVTRLVGFRFRPAGLCLAAGLVLAGAGGCWTHNQDNPGQGGPSGPTSQGRRQPQQPPVSIHYREYNLQVALDPQFTAGGRTPPNVEVNVVGVNPAMRDWYANLSMTNWWEQGTDREAAIKAGAVKVIELGPSQTSAALDKNDPVWLRWRETGIQYLFVLVNMPREAPDKPGDQDGRRAIIELDGRKWQEQETLKLRVDPSGVHVDSR